MLISSALLPGDLLSLSRSSKKLRAIFMSRSTRPIWAKAFANAATELGLPVGCPIDMNEPEHVIAFKPTGFTTVFDSDSAHIARKEISRKAAKLTYPIGWRERSKSGERYHGAMDVSDANGRFAQPSNKYSVVEFSLVADKCLELRDNEEALGQYLEDRRVMAKVIAQARAIECKNAK
ncbi:hypothetical protein DXG01_002945 [Tephrocybe rancida]|nr:hypothetical protein DXG01_002945 [Tephrocybe rancida]